MEIRVLKYFLAVAREQNITAAANFLHLTQPTLSRQIADLENELGVKLLERKSHHVALTAEGRLFRKRAEEIVSLVDKTEMEFNNSQELVGDVYIGSGETIAIDKIAKIIKRINDVHPDIRFHFQSGNAQDTFDKIDRGLLDFGIVIEPADVTRYESIDLNSYDTWGVIVRRDDPLAQKKKITKEDLLNRRLIVSKQMLSEDDRMFRGWFDQDIKTLDIAGSYNLLYNASILVLNGIGIALTLDKLADTSKKSGLVFRRLEPVLRSKLTLIYKRYQVFSKASELFLSEVKKYQQLSS